MNISTAHNISLSAPPHSLLNHSRNKDVKGVTTENAVQNTNQVNHTLITTDEVSSTLSQQNPTYQRPLSNSSDAADKVSQSDMGQSTEIDSEIDESTSNEASEFDKENSQPEYTDEELTLIDSLKSRDLEVIAHEKAHATVGGQHTGSPSYDYQTGPDGVKYAVSGEVSIDISSIPGDPQATLQKAQQIKAAALAPSEPSAQDIKVARKADQMAADARSDILNDGNAASIDGNNEDNINNNTQETLDITNKQEEKEAISTKMEQRNNQINTLYQNSVNTHQTYTLEIQV